MRRAELAVQKGDDELAREALKRKKSYQVRIASREGRHHICGDTSSASPLRCRDILSFDRKGPEKGSNFSIGVMMHLFHVDIYSFMI